MPKCATREVQQRVGKRVAALRQLRGLTQEDFAERLNVSVQYVQRVERGAANLTIGSLVKLANALGTDPSAFFRVDK